MDLTTIGFDYGTTQIKVVLIKDEMWFVGKEVCDVLGIENARDAISRLDDDEKMLIRGKEGLVGITDDPNITQLTLVSEPGLYALIGKSRKPEAKAFDRWVRHEVLPTIRKTGSYEVPNKRNDEIRWNEAEAKVRNSRARQAKVIADMLNKFADRLSDNSVTLLVGEVAEIAAGRPVLPKPKTEALYKASDIAKELGTSANKIGRVAKDLGLKTEEYGEFVLDKSPYSEKQIPNFLYNEKGRSRLSAYFQGELVTEM